MAFAIICDRCGQIIIPGISTCTSVRYTKNEIMDTFMICDSCTDELKLWINGKELEDDE